MVTRRRVVASTLVATLAGCLDGDPEEPADGVGTTVSGAPADADGQASNASTATPGEGALEVTSSAFSDGDAIPRRYTGEGEDVSPPLSIRGVPDDARSLALAVDDPDAPDPPFTHWLCWAIPPDVGSIPDGLPADERLQQLDGAVQGTNDFGELGYRGPMPPTGDGPHRYRFTVHAIDRMVELDPGASRAELEATIEGQILASGRLEGRYER